MIEFGGIIYYIDIEAFDKAITPKGVKPTDEVIVKEKKEVTNENGQIVGTETLVTTSLRGKEIDGPKYDVLREMIMVLLDNDDESDTSLGAERVLEKQPLSYKLAFNTLYKYGVIKEKEE